MSEGFIDSSYIFSDQVIKSYQAAWDYDAVNGTVSERLSAERLRNETLSPTLETPYQVKVILLTRYMLYSV